MCLHLVLKELRLWVFQYYLGYQWCFRFTWVAHFFPIGILWFLRCILGFSGFFLYAIPFLRVAFLILFQSWTRGARHWFVETSALWSFPHVHHYLLVWGGSFVAPFGNHVAIHCVCNCQTLAVWDLNKSSWNANLIDGILDNVDIDLIVFLEIFIGNEGVNMVSHLMVFLHPVHPFHLSFF